MESPEYCVVCKLRIDKAFILLFFSWLNFGFFYALSIGVVGGQGVARSSVYCFLSLSSGFIPLLYEKCK